MTNKKVAYMSMEVGLESKMPTYSGGLGILAGDTLKSAADLGLPIVGVTILYHKGYVKQKLNQEGYQIEDDNIWKPSEKMKLLPNEVEVKIENRDVKVKAWEYTIKGVTGHEVPVYFLDTNVEGNSETDKVASRKLYSGDDYLRILQEAVLGIGGVKMLKSLGHSPETYHMNEGHAAFLTFELLKERGWKDSEVKKSCVFTTHSPVAGQDSFDYGLVQKMLGDLVPWHVRRLAGDGRFSTAYLALNLSRFANAVSKKHAGVSRGLFPGYAIDYVTNGVHSTTWTSKSFKKLYDQLIPGWRENPSLLEKAIEIPGEKLWDSHQKSKAELLKRIPGFSKDILTIGYARRAVSYKRMDLIFSDLEKLAAIGNGKLQLVFAGKAHPDNHEGKRAIQKIVKLEKTLESKGIKLAFLEDYDMDLGLLLTSGCDVWLNNPIVPLEACGTSGMKSCHNGVPQFSTVDGWWAEGWEEGLTGWAIGGEKSNDAEDAKSFYDKLEHKIIPLYYNDKDGWTRLMKNTIMRNAPKFNSHRMVEEYKKKAYSL